MRARITFLLVLAFFLLPLPAHAQWGEVVEGCSVASGENLLKDRLDAILKQAKSLKKAQVSIQIAAAPSDGTLFYEKNPDKTLTPASVTKIVTASAALTYLGQEYTFPTELYGNLSKDGASVVGDLYVKGYGDPSLISERLYLLAESLYGRGIRTIEGDLVVDDTYFDDERFNKNWEGAGSDESYVAATGAFSVNFNALTLVVRPGAHIGDPGRIVTEPLTHYVQIENKTTTSRPRTGHTLDASRFSGDRKPKVIVTGRIPIDLGQKNIYKNVEAPPYYAGTLLSEFFERSNITLRGQVRTGQVPPELPLFDGTTSKPLGLIIRDLNKFSNNFVAEQLVKTLGTRNGEQVGSWPNGIEFLNEFLKNIETPAGGWKLYDGSGLSQKNRLSARTLVHVLRHIFQDPRLRADFEASLSLGGADGTVRRRFKDPRLAKRVRAKTGHLAGVSALAGYLYPETMRPLAFAVLINGFEGGFGAVEADVDSLISEILNACALPEIQQAAAPPLAPKEPAGPDGGTPSSP